MTVQDDPRVPDTDAVRAYLLGLQEHILVELERLDGKSFLRDNWQFPSDATLRGDGRTRVLEDGDFFERGGVNFSHVMGDCLPPSASATRPELTGRAFEALGISLVLHPRNPYCPTVHFNVRLLITTAPGEALVFWFGGGIDLTPYYPFEEDCRHFHQTCKDTLDPFGKALYPNFKAWCDEYFYLKHRQEPRGIGGIFFDDFTGESFDDAFDVMKSVGNAFLDAYVPIVERRRGIPYGKHQRDFQAHRRGRYVEFNLMFDRGTQYGIQSSGRTESILMSMPPIAKWHYDWHPAKNSPEAKLYTDFLIHREWV
ncbi:oxygen-dependent coproporphyrinogen oxidase [Candidatus Pandoraea novymonadis]|uniref:Oxygen-dependent coproporphyrinogen-III oxidase n=1 Tax=Candidatus Pandoraea novymonadis TaxID=1808959 RepID=A0ABX5FF65_9BURK|nr:oxygen-dependent coproporphyrinogen oxidase [Candidatus Pandoraea novymonadis]PSB91667.1 Oxygen-dependent coproporphyrinogen-III oxidase [Candidatus Pandoraea novymonadis]